MTSIETLLFRRGIRSLKPGLLIYNEVGEDGEHGATCGALEPPDGDPTHTEADIMRVAGETPSTATARLVGELKAEGEDERKHEFDKRLAIVKELNVGRFVVKINRDSPVFVGLTGSGSHASPSSPTGS